MNDTFKRSSTMRKEDSPLDLRLSSKERLSESKIETMKMNIGQTKEMIRALRRRQRPKRDTVLSAHKNEDWKDCPSDISTPKTTRSNMSELNNSRYE